MTKRSKPPESPFKTIWTIGKTILGVLSFISFTSWWQARSIGADADLEFQQRNFSKACEGYSDALRKLPVFLTFGQSNLNGKLGLCLMVQSQLVDDPNKRAEFLKSSIVSYKKSLHWFTAQSVKAKTYGELAGAYLMLADLADSQVNLEETTRAASDALRWIDPTADVDAWLEAIRFKGLALAQRSKLENNPSLLKEAYQLFSGVTPEQIAKGKIAPPYFILSYVQVKTDFMIQEKSFGDLDVEVENFESFLSTFRGDLPTGQEQRANLYHHVSLLLVNAGVCQASTSLLKRGVLFCQKALAEVESRRDLELKADIKRELINQNVNLSIAEGNRSLQLLPLKDCLALETEFPRSKYPKAFGMTEAIVGNIYLHNFKVSRDPENLKNARRHFECAIDLLRSLNGKIASSSERNLEEIRSYEESIRFNRPINIIGKPPHSKSDDPAHPCSSLYI